jgi:hypothetical protein
VGLLRHGFFMPLFTNVLEEEFSEVPEWGVFSEARHRERLLLARGLLCVSALSGIVSLRSDDLLEDAS